MVGLKIRVIELVWRLKNLTWTGDVEVAAVTEGTMTKFCILVDVWF